MMIVPHLPRTAFDDVFAVICLVLFVAWLIYDVIRRRKNRK